MNNLNGNTNEGGVEAITQPVGNMEIRVNPGTFADMNELLTQINQAVEVNDSLQTTISNTVNLACNSVVGVMVPINSRVVAGAFQIGSAMIMLRSKMSIDTDEDLSSDAPYRKLMDRILDDYATAQMADAVGYLDDNSIAMMRVKLRASRRRQINKYISLAECGPGILDYGYGGIEAALEVRYLLLDMLADGKSKVAISPETADKVLSIVKDRHPFPTPEEVAGKDVRAEFRLHVDKVATICQCRAAGFDLDDIDPRAAKACAKKRQEALEYGDAVKIFKDMESVPKENRRADLSMRLAAYVSDEKVRRPKPNQIGDHLAKFIAWGDKVEINDDTVSTIMDLPNIKSNISRAKDVITRLYEAINDANTESSGQQIVRFL